jgi:hypothetical protein
VGSVPVFRIVLTGGPCGGKTTCLSAITERMQGLAFQVYRIPETATLLLGGGTQRKHSSFSILRIEKEECFLCVPRRTMSPLFSPLSNRAGNGSGKPTGPGSRRMGTNAGEALALPWVAGPSPPRS